MENNITDNTSEMRFEMRLENEIAFINYERDGAVLYLTHTEVPIAFRGKGKGFELIEKVLEYLRGTKQTVVAECPTIKKFVLSHKGFEFVIAD